MSWPSAVPGNPFHVPGRPHWRCIRCGNEWPCPTAKTELLTGYRGMKLSLSMLLASQWVDCLNDLCALNPSKGETPSTRDLYERFFNWAELGVPD
ncbi:hypothetical protein AB0J90_34370 [Micromonospora sp. NPDC049523]|uniref:hypothetical protein n=1 Tax=Micromonospora sp. NPDC049523 TaxID=3155921 RepID=UPI00343DAFF2